MTFILIHCRRLWPISDNGGNYSLNAISLITIKIALTTSFHFVYVLTVLLDHQKGERNFESWLVFALLEQNSAIIEQIFYRSVYCTVIVLTRGQRLFLSKNDVIWTSIYHWIKLLADDEWIWQECKELVIKQVQFNSSSWKESTLRYPLCEKLEL